MKKLFIRFILLSLWSLLFGAATTSCVGESEPDWSLQPGDRLPEFTVRTLDGRVVSNKTFEGKKGYIVFFSTTCSDCRRELPKFEEQYRSLMASGEADEIEYICISRAEDATSVLAYWEANGLTMPVAAETDRTVYNLFAASGIPRLYISEDSIITAVIAY